MLHKHEDASSQPPCKVPKWWSLSHRKVKDRVQEIIPLKAERKSLQGRFYFTYWTWRAGSTSQKEGELVLSVPHHCTFCSGSTATWFNLSREAELFPGNTWECTVWLMWVGFIKLTIRSQSANCDWQSSWCWKEQLRFSYKFDIFLPREAKQVLLACWHLLHLASKVKSTKI